MNPFWHENAPFIKVFRGHHLVYILGMFTLFFLMVRNKRKIIKNRELVRRSLLMIAILQQMLLYSWYIFETGFALSEALPFHISRISSILGIVFLITINKNILDILFYFGLFAYGSLIYPQRVYTFYHVLGISYFINHALTILLPLIAMIVSEWRPTKSGLYKAYSWFVFYFFFVYFLNLLIDGNYFYLKYRPFFAHWPDVVYIPVALATIFLLFWIGYNGARWLERWVSRPKN